MLTLPGTGSPVRYRKPVSGITADPAGPAAAPDGP